MVHFKTQCKVLKTKMQKSLIFRISIKDQTQKHPKHYMCLWNSTLYINVSVYECKDTWNNLHLLLRKVISRWWYTTFTFLVYIYIICIFCNNLKNNKVIVY